MIFLNATLIFGGLAIAIPIALHLLSRRQPKRVVFPSIGLLQSKASFTRSRVKIKRWWLLALRIAALLMLAIAFAQPTIDSEVSSTWINIAVLIFFGVGLLLLSSLSAIRGMSRTITVGLILSSSVILISAIVWGGRTLFLSPSNSPNSNASQAVVILIDNGPTAAWKDNRGQRLQQMKSLCRQFIKELPSSSQICVLGRSTQVASFSVDKNSAINKTQQLTVIEAARPIRERIQVALKLLESSRLQTQRILLLSDLAQSSWKEMTETEPLLLSNEKGIVDLTIYDLGEFTGGNRGLSLLRIADQSPPPNTPTPITFSVFSDKDSKSKDESITVQLEIFENSPGLPVVKNGEIVLPIGRTVDRSSIQLNEPSRKELLLSVPALPIGTHHGLIRLTGQDALALDDVRYFTLEVLPPSKVLIVSDDAVESRFIKTALSSASFGDSGSEYEIDSVYFTDLPIVRLESYDVVVLLTPPEDRRSVQAITDYLNDGGRMLVSFGGESNLRSDDNHWVSGTTRKWGSPPPVTFFQPVDYQHPLLKSLGSNVPWADFRVKQYWQVEPSDQDQVIIRFAGTKHPAILERNINKSASDNREDGKLMMIMTPFPAVTDKNKKWNNLFGANAWPAWLLCRQGIEYLANRFSSVNEAQVGNSYSMRVREDLIEKTDAMGYLFSPGNLNPSPILGLETSDYLRIGNVSKSGTYWIRGDGLRKGFSANLPEAATRTGRIKTSDLETVLNPNHYQVISDFEEMVFREFANSNQVSLHSPAIFLVAMIFVLEQVISNRFYQRKTLSLNKLANSTKNLRFAK